MHGNNAATDIPIPPPELRRRVTGTESAEVFLTSGQQSLGDLACALAGVGRELMSFERVLDWGCGCGRVTRWLGAELEGRELVSVDVDPAAIKWCAEHLPFGRFMVCNPRPPLDVPDSHFDLVVNHSVLTHLDASMQDEWLTELRRITRPGALIILSVHGDDAFATNAMHWDAERVAERWRALETVGILYVSDYVDSPFPDFYQVTYHATWYVFTHWARHLPIVAYYPRGALSFQDIVVLTRPAPDDKNPHAPIVPAGYCAAAAESLPSSPAHDLQRLGGLIDEGPPLTQPTRYGVLSRLVRRIMGRATANLRDHQQHIDRRHLLALGDLERTDSRLDYGQLIIRQSLTHQSDRIARLENQVAELLEASAEDGSAARAGISSENRELEPTTQHARTFKAKLAAVQIDVSQLDMVPLASDSSVQFVEVAPGTHSPPMPPCFVLGPFPEYLTRTYFGDVNALPVGCYYVDGARVTSHGLLTRNGKLLVNKQLGLSRETIAIARLFGPVCVTDSFSWFVDEPIASVIGPGYLVYGHWLVDILPKLYLLHRAGIDTLGVKYLIPKDTPEFGVAFLRLAGISDSQLIHFDPYTEVIGARHLILPTLVHTNDRAHPLFPLAVEYLLSLIRRRHRIPTVAREHLFVSRQGVNYPRKLVNRAAIEQIAAEAGFKIYRPETFSLLDQLATFASATSIVGEYGSGLHASIFAPPEIAVFALRSNAMFPGFLQSGLCQVMNQKIAYILGAAGKDDFGYQEFMISEHDFKIGLQWFKEFLM
jgi:SAM-dependent methyltransferase